MAPDDAVDPGEQLALSDLINRVLDKGVVLVGTVTIAVADIDLVQLELRLLLQAVETGLRRALPSDADLSALPRAGGD